MRTKWQLIWGMFYAAVLVGLLAGCAMIPRENIASNATDYNLVVEKVQNEMLLLNIVRASKRRPMYFTTFNVLRGSLSYNFQTGNMNVPYATFKGGSNVFSIAPSISYSNNPFIEVSVLNTKEFTRGMLEPASVETVDYFWKQGWPKDLLLLLFVNRIETANESGKKVFRNYPSDKDFKDFQDKIDNLAKPECEFMFEVSPEPVGAKLKLSSNDASNLKNYIDMQKAGLNVEQKGDDYQLISQKKDYYLVCGNQRYYIADSKQLNQIKKSSNQKMPAIYMRSPEAILYYLGEIMRAENPEANINSDLLPKVTTECEKENVKQDLFKAHKLTEMDKNLNVSVDYEGTTYVIPRENAYEDKCHLDSSMKVLTLFSLLLGKQITASELPPTTGVTTTLGGH